MIKINVDKENCIGCGACVSVAPEVFELNDEGKAEVMKMELDEEELQKAKEAVDTCPVQVIQIEG